ncbi:chloride channel protein [Minwuia thermotolerans]|uniref:Chloride channel protein n=1 Tax=Minwuia thermotolerans TaxID=2056226 RepID=A0A2M9G7G1_9PROT|nr:chloride channel protein [Minwuia thermotolerans]PJK31642.1 chloride channel protein [Minwuia thermotolerans]
MPPVVQRAREWITKLFRESLRDFRPFRDLAAREQMTMLLFAVLTGLTVGYAAYGFRLSLSAVQYLFYGVGTEYLVQTILVLPWWHVVLAPALGGLAVALFLKFVMPGHRPQGVAEVIEAGMYHNGRMSFRAGMGAAFTSALSIGAGASVGREGPLVHLGGSIASILTKRLNLSRLDGHTMLACGVAAGVAASFNAPIAGVIFAHEVVLGHYALRALAPVVISGVCGTIVTRIHIGDFPAFLIPDYDILSFWQFPAFMMLGLVSGLMALIFFWSVGFTRDVIGRTRIPDFWRPPIAGLAVGVIALQFPEVLGVGYEATDNALNQVYPLHLLILLVAAKMAATSICVSGGFGGGVFSPALFIGAMTGGAFGLIAANVFPELAAEHGLYAIVGMGAVASAVLGAPISTTLIVFELTGDYRVTIALMVAVVLATVMARQFRYPSFFHWQLARRAVKLAETDEVLLHAQVVADVMVTDVETISPEMSFGELREVYRDSSAQAYYVVDADGRIQGALNEADVKYALLDPMLDNLGRAVDIASQTGPLLTPDMPLDEALTAFRGTAHRFLAVVDSPVGRRLLGTVAFRTVLEAHNRALKAAQAETR